MKRIIKQHFHKIISVICAVLIALSTSVFSVFASAVIEGMGTVLTVVDFFNLLAEAAGYTGELLTGGLIESSVSASLDIADLKSWKVLQSVYDEDRSKSLGYDIYYELWALDDDRICYEIIKDYVPSQVNKDGSVTPGYPCPGITFKKPITDFSQIEEWFATLTPSSDIQGDLKTDSDNFKMMIEKVETFYSPSGELERLSWKNDNRWKSLEDKEVNSSGTNSSYYRHGRMTLMTNGKFVDKWNCVYLCPYYFDGSNIYYSSKIIFLYFDGDVAGEADFCLKVYDSLANTISDPYTIVSGFKKSCIDINFDMDNGRSDFLCFSYADDFTYFSDNTYLSASYREGTHYGNSQLCSDSSYGDAKACSHIKGISKLLNSTDIYSVLDFHSSEAYKKFLNVTTYDTVEDYGFVCSDAYFYPEVGGYTDLDVEKIPVNTTVTITGDSIGDCIYTDNTTGDTTTINNYIMNNYNYPDDPDSPDNPDNPDPGGGGSVSGDVTVGGSVAVGGQIDINTKPIDVNINVNNGSVYPIGTGEVPQPYVNGEDVNLTEYLDHVPEISKGFTDYLKDFFVWLPPEIYGLIILGLVVAIWCRLAGR